MVSNDARISVGVISVGCGVMDLVTFLESDRKALCNALMLKKCLCRQVGYKSSVT